MQSANDHVNLVSLAVVRSHDSIHRLDSSDLSTDIVVDRSSIAGAVAWFFFKFDEHSISLRKFPLTLLALVSYVTQFALRIYTSIVYPVSTDDESTGYYRDVISPLVIVLALMVSSYGAIELVSSAYLSLVFDLHLKWRTVYIVYSIAVCSFLVILTFLFLKENSIAIPILSSVFNAFAVCVTLNQMQNITKLMNHIFPELYEGNPKIEHCRDGLIVKKQTKSVESTLNKFVLSYKKLKLLQLHLSNKFYLSLLLTSIMMCVSAFALIVVQSSNLLTEYVYTECLLFVGFAGLSAWQVATFNKGIMAVEFFHKIDTELAVTVKYTGWAPTNDWLMGLVLGAITECLLILKKYVDTHTSMLKK
jgi:hypothetical protein